MLDIKASTERHTENLQRRIDLYAYLQLAKGYYERGLQANVKYLQSIGQRNAIRQQEQQPQQQQRHKQRHKQRRYSLEAWPQQQQQRQQQEEQQPVIVVKPQPTALPARLSAILNGLQQREGCQTAIRVHIAPVQQQHKASMCDYNNRYNNNNNNRSDSSHNSSSNNNRQRQQQQQPHSATAEIIDQAQQQRKLYEIIDNLSELSVCDSRASSTDKQRLIHLSQLNLCDSRNSLPRIVFTDYTQQVAVYGANLEYPTTKPDHQIN